jgi:hypothetical protein
MKHLLKAWTKQNAILAGLATACVLVIFPGVADAVPSVGQFGGVRIGPVSIGYSAFGRGRYGYGSRYGYSGNRSYSGHRNNAFNVYGRGSYGHHNGYNTGYGNRNYSGRNRNYNTYRPYSSNYIRTSTYSPFGFGVQRSYGW